MVTCGTAFPGPFPPAKRRAPQRQGSTRRAASCTLRTWPRSQKTARRQSSPWALRPVPAAWPSGRRPGNGGAYSGPQGGGNGKDVPAYPTGTPGTRGPAEGQGEPAVTVPVTITINPEIVIQAAAQGMSPEDIVALLKEKIRDMVDDISDEMAEKLARIFANMPVRGGA